jgi:hypothetical protein
VGSVALSTGLAEAALDDAAVVVFVAESEPLQAVPAKPIAAARIMAAYALRVIDSPLPFVALTVAIRAVSRS